ncbi:MAG: TonB-dependent receptor, partial [Pseudomonadota bacterium]
MMIRIWLAFIAACPFLITPALAQRAAENVVRSADDAFGASVGDEEIGLYGSDDVRGFSPISAGNIRVEGLTIDRQTGFTDRLVSSSTIRAGLAAQGYLLPAPTGIVDFSLRRVADTPVQSFIAGYGDFGGYSFAADLQARLLQGLVETTIGAGYERNNSGNGTRDLAWTLGGTLRVLPSDRVDLTVFGDYRRDIADQRWVGYFPAGSFEPPLPSNIRDDVGQPWVEQSGDNYNLGVIARYAPSIADIEVGIFRS